MPKFRKKPIVIEAKRVGDPSYATLSAWCGGATLFDPQGRPVGVLINTLEGEMRASRGDWIIKGVKGEFYPCKPDIFAATYEPVEEES